MKKKKLLSIAILFSCSDTHMLYSSESLRDTQVDNFSKQHINELDYNYDDEFYEDEDGYDEDFEEEQEENIYHDAESLPVSSFENFSMIQGDDEQKNHDGEYVIEPLILNNTINELENSELSEALLQEDINELMQSQENTLNQQNIDSKINDVDINNEIEDKEQNTENNSILNDFEESFNNESNICSSQEQEQQENLQCETKELSEDENKEDELGYIEKNILSQQGNELISTEQTNTAHEIKEIKDMLLGITHQLAITNALLINNTNKNNESEVEQMNNNYSQCNNENELLSSEFENDSLLGMDSLIDDKLNAWQYIAMHNKNDESNNGDMRNYSKRKTRTDSIKSQRNKRHRN